uniref:Uncharacterized protein n=1 Tax=Heterorhabditis bacteriophora TaxID=37862 RepID=A0A1I7WNS7_HETBA
MTSSVFVSYISFVQFYNYS